MKKIIRISVILLGIFMINISCVNAQSLDCSSTLRYGSTGSSVSTLQQMLNSKMNCGLSVDGSFGSLTKSCVIEYQKAHNLTQDGIVGPNTCSSLNTSVIGYYNNSNTYGVITGSSVNVRSSNSTSSSIIGNVSLGTIFKIYGSSNGWYKVVYNKKYGYVRSDLISLNTILVDISNQRLYFYNNGKLSWTTRVVTGNKGNHDTPTGKYTLSPSNFKRNTYLRGSNDDGTKYKSYVSYWMPFSVEIGFHDASWRSNSEYTTSTFNGDGSHGCVNMMYEAAYKLYNSVTSNMTVVVRN